MKIAILGGGSWGTAIARLLAMHHNDVTLYIRETPQANYVDRYRENPHFLPGVKIPHSLLITDSIKEATKEAGMIVLGVPTGACREVMNDIASDLMEGAIIVSLAKGIEIESLKRVSEIAEEILPNNAFVCLSGPSHAEEVGRDIPTTVTVSSNNPQAAKLVQETFHCETFRVYTNEDLVGVELGGALKNIIALAAGMTDGCGYGDNTKAALMTRGMYEIAKLGTQMGGHERTFYGLAGMGDLIVTCTSMHSRNRRCGILIGQGKSVEEAIEEVGMVVEGIKTTRSAFELSNRYDVDMPITRALYRIIYESEPVKEAVQSLMMRTKKEEFQAAALQ